MRNLFCLTCLFLCSLFIDGYAQTQSIDDIRNERKQVMEQIKKTNQALASNNQSLQMKLHQYTVLSDQIKESEKYLALLNEEYRQTNRKIAQMKEQEVQQAQLLATKQQQYAKLVRQLYIRMDTDSRLMFIFSADNLQQSLRRMRYLNEYSRFQRQQAEDIKVKQEELKILRVKLQESLQTQAELLTEQKQEQELLKQERNKQNGLLKILRRNESNLRADLKQQQKKASDLNRQIEKIIADEQQKVSKENNRTQETKSSYAMTVDEKKLANEFGKNQGKLPFPVSEPGTIIVHFGQQKHRDMQYVNTQSNGIDILTSEGAYARAIFNGTVTKIFSVQGSNFSIIVRHGNYLSVYSNIEKVIVKSGEKVKIGESLGKIHTENEPNALTIMHFQIWKDLQRMDPERWIKKK